MNTMVLILTLMFICAIVVGLLLWFKIHRTLMVPAALTSIKPTHRKLTPEERLTIRQYKLTQHNPFDFQTFPASKPHSIATEDHSLFELTLIPQSDNVYAVTQAITRYGIASDEPNKWRYYLDTTEIHLPSFLEQYITADNYVEVIQTQTIPLVISLNGHSLQDYNPQNLPEHPRSSSAQNASIRKEDGEHIELINIRKETPEEHTLNSSNGLKEMCAICTALLLLFVSLIGPIIILPWLVLTSAILIIWGNWSLFRPLSDKDLREIHCLNGTPKRWGLFGESDLGQIRNISLGIIDLIYPPHWQPYFTYDLGKKTNIDIYLNRQVVRQGQYLSLHDEVKKFPLQRYGKNLILMLGSLLILILLIIYIPLSLPLKLSMAWLQGVQTQQVTSAQSLEKMPLKVGDILKAQGTGMCYVSSSEENDYNAAFAPFNCSTIYWNTAEPLPPPSSEFIEKAVALITSVNKQLHPENNIDHNVNPQLATAIEKSGMVLLVDFADIVLKTQALCRKEPDCIRLKNALVNLGNAKTWAVLAKKAQSGSLEGTKVLLRPVSADALATLVNTATSSFVYRETHNAIKKLNSPLAGGFMIISEENNQLVDHPLPAVPLYDFSALEQWRELQRLSNLLLRTQFKAEGIITNITIDTNGTQRITLHSQPTSITLGRYLGTSLLLLLVTVCIFVNGWLWIKRMNRNRRRMEDIQNYYNRCFSITATTSIEKKT